MGSRKVAAAVFAAFGLAVSGASAQGRPDLVEQSLGNSAREYVPGEMLVQFRRGVADDDKVDAVGRIGGALVDDVAMTSRRADNRGDLHLVRLPLGLSIAAAMRGLQNDPTVDFAEPNWVYRHQATANDTYYANGSLWGMYGDGSSPANQFGSQAAEAWGAGKTDCSSVYVGIIDEGYMYAHPDLAANAATNPGETAGNGGRDGAGDDNDRTANYPSNYPNANVIAVAALTSSGAKASFSNYGKTTVDLGAPGQAVWSTVPVRSKGEVVGGYASYSGTSMATPHVTGAAALYKAYHPAATAAQIKAAILGSSVPTPSLNNITVSGGRLNVSGF